MNRLGTSKAKPGILKPKTLEPLRTSINKPLKTLKRHLSKSYNAHKPRSAQSLLKSAHHRLRGQLHIWGVYPKSLKHLHLEALGIGTRVLLATPTRLSRTKPRPRKLSALSTHLQPKDPATRRHYRIQSIQSIQSAAKLMTSGRSSAWAGHRHCSLC